MLEFLRAMIFGRLCFATRKRVNEAPRPWDCPRELRRRPTKALKAEASKSTRKIVSRQDGRKQQLFTSGQLNRILCYLKTM
jgi:hypothetical protein